MVQAEPVKPGLDREPMWLVAMADQRLALMREALTPAGLRALRAIDTTLTMLTEPPEYATAAQHKLWDQSCDNCGKHCPKDLVIGHLIRDLDGNRILLIIGACPACTELP